MKVGQGIYDEAGPDFGTDGFDGSSDLCGSFPFRSQNGSLYYLQTDAGGQVCGVDDGDFVGSFQFFCSKPHNVAGGGHAVGDGETDDLPAFFHKRLHDFHGLGQRRSRGLGRGLVFIGPPENFFRRNIHAIAVFILAQQNVQRQDGNVILFH